MKTNAQMGRTKKAKQGWWVLALLLILIYPASPRAQNDQIVVFGLGLGNYAFSKVDDLRRPDPASGYDENFTQGEQLQYYLEWYALKKAGFGLRQIISGGVQNSRLGGSRKIYVTHTLLTATYLPYGATPYKRIGLMAGLGTASYFASQVGGNSFRETSKGTSTLLGAYIDWGGGDFGARFGANMLNTNLANIGPIDVDGSGVGVYLDMRWAWL